MSRKYFFFSSRRRHTRCYRDWSSDVCSSDLSRLARRVAGARIGWRLPGRRATNYDAGVSDYESMLAREAVRRYMPDIALYVSSVLLACVVGASIALYLN